MTPEREGPVGRTGTSADPDRRRFLMLAGLALSAGSGGVSVAGCSRTARISASASPSVSTSASSAPVTISPSPPAPGDWSTLGTRLSTGRLVRPGSSDYSTARQLFDPRFDNTRPAGIAYCASPQDVSACLA